MNVEDEHGNEHDLNDLRDQDREPEPEDIDLDLDAIDAAYEASLKESCVMGQNTSAALFAVPQLTTALRGYRETEEMRAALPTHAEWAMTASRDQQPNPGRWYDTVEEAEQQYGRPGQLWARTLTIGAAIPISGKAPF